jgi:hypothetical protein
MLAGQEGITMLLTIASAVFALAAADPAAAEPTPATTTQAAPAAQQGQTQAKKEDLDRVLCKREAEVGSHRPRKICMTIREWRTKEDETQNLLRNMNTPSETVPGTPNS